MQDKQKNKILFVLGFLIFSYTLVRSYLLSFTWDESFSYLQFVRNGLFFCKTYDSMSANNHLLNTWLDIYLIKIFGVSEFVLRLPAVFAHFLFLFFSVKLVKNFVSIGIVVASFLIINLNPYVLDFFSLSRGYGLSIGLMMVSIYYVSVFIANGFKTTHAVNSIFLAGLATLANFVLFNYFVVSFVVILFLLVLNFYQTHDKNKRLLFKSFLFPLVIFVLYLLFLLPIALKLKNAGALYFGGNNNFWSSTISSIVNCSFYEIKYNQWFQRFAKVAVVAVFTMATGFVVVRFLKSKSKSKAKQNNLFLIVLVLLLGLCSLSTIVQQYVFKTPYLIYRTAIFLLVIFNLLFVVFINECTKIKSNSVWVTYLASVFSVFHFILTFNLTHVYEWRWDADIKQMIVDLDKVKKIPQQKNNISLAIPLEFDGGVNFYRAFQNLTWLNTVVKSDFKDKRYDYLFFGPEEFKKVNRDSIQIIKQYSGTNNILAKQKYAPNLTKVYFLQQLHFEHTTAKQFVLDETTEYSQAFNYTINDSITPDKNAEVVVNSIVKSQSVFNSNLFVVISFENTKGCYSWGSVSVKDYIVKANDWTNVHFSVFVPKQCKQGDLLKAYIWNPHQQRLQIKNMELKWLAKP